MTERGGPSEERPAPAPSAPPQAPQGWSGGVRREGHGPVDAGAEAGGDGDPGAVLAPREEALIAEAVTSVGRRGRGPVFAGVLIAAAFLLGLLRPWDLVAPRSDQRTPVPGSTSSSAAGRTAPPAPTRALTCAYPSQWRSSTIEDWTGRQARVWKAVDVVDGTGPDDPTIPFAPIVAATVTAIGWCAPVDGPDRPPLALDASLFRIENGAATPVPHDRLEPAEADALGELWVPRPLGVGNRPPWTFGRYVIELRSGSGSYVRYLGLELTDRVVRPAPSSAAPASSATPASSSPSGSP